eukprot:CAMPEP_0117545048 /NCGR_PEP_ID=MMETSP0784-20121206/45893_1 /TAXON_ID=39447 /ORGANISM="" /LENGTH=275 /DNA_ID=CAMNT_0005341881 /DNA_START=11 /DNA_END=836 /DNA_ORIENTATION=+
MSLPYVNVQQEPPRGASMGFGGFVRSMTSNFLPQQADEEFGNPYINIEAEAAFHEDFARHKGSFRDVVRSTLPGFLFPSDAPPKPANSTGSFFGGGARKASIIRSMTPSFLHSEEDEDMASTCCPNIGFKQRVFGCVCCVALGQLLQFLSYGSLLGVLIGRPGRFAMLYSLGNLMMVAASFFFSGPRQQCRKIKAKDRAVTSMVFLSAMLLTLAVVFGRPFFCRAFVILLLVIVQWFAQVWYVLSYVPYGHTFGRKVVNPLGGGAAASERGPPPL